MKLASIDIGTNTFRLLIAETGDDGNPRHILLKREITRLGGGFDGTVLHPESKKRAMDTLKRFASIVKEYGVDRVKGVATSVLRESEDGEAFISDVRRKTGIDIDIISGDLEASLTLKGVLSALDGAEKSALVFDIGGGSTEYIVADRGAVKGLKSLNMGVVSLTEGFLHSDPPCSDDISEMTRIIDDFLIGLEKDLESLDIINPSGYSLLVGTAGTITTLAAMDQGLEIYDTRKINNYRLSRRSVKDLFARLVSMTNMERADIKGLEEGRADLIIAGTIIVLRTMEFFGFDEMVVSDYGLLEGVMLDLADVEGGQWRN